MQSLAIKTNHVVLYLADEEEVLSLHNTLLDLRLNGSTHFSLISINEGSVNVPVSHINGILYGLSHLTGCRLQIGNIPEDSLKYYWIKSKLKLAPHNTPHHAPCRDRRQRPIKSTAEIFNIRRQ